MKSIVFLSNNRKRALLSHFCIAYKHILSKYPLFATYGTSCVIKETGLSVFPLLSKSLGGLHQVISKISSEEVGLVVFFRDVSSSLVHFSDFSLDLELLNTCDLYCVPCATNILTAEVLLRSLDFDEYF